MVVALTIIIYYARAWFKRWAYQGGGGWEVGGWKEREREEMILLLQVFKMG
jgi:hypothetical protein